MADVESPAGHPASSTAYDAGSTSPASHRSMSRGLKIALSCVSIAVGLTLGLGFGLGGNRGSDVSSSENINAGKANEVDNLMSPEENSMFTPSDSTSPTEKNDHEENGGLFDPPNNESDLDESQSVGMESEVVVESELPAQYFRSEGPVPAQVRAFPPPVSDAYETCSELEKDVAEALKYYANQVIVEQSKDDLYSNCDPANPNWMSEYYGYDYRYGYLPPPVMYEYGYDETQGEEKLSNGTVDVKRSNNIPHKNLHTSFGGPRSSSQKSKVSGAKTRTRQGVTEDSSQTNSQVYGVDNADVVKSNGNHVFAAYGDILYAWNSENGGTDGVSMTTMPLGEAEDCSDSYSYGYSNDTAPCTYVSKPRVQALLLNGDRLTAVVTQDRYDATIPIVYDFSILSVRVYDISSVPNDGSPLVEIGTTNITGSFWSGRSIGDTNLIVSMSYINAYMFVEDLYRYQPQYCGLNTSEYIQLATETVANDAGSVAEEIVNGLELDSDCSRVFHVSAMQDPNSSPGIGSGDNNSDFQGINILGQFAHITSIDVSSAGVDGIIPAIASGTFVPGGGYLSSIYATEDLIVTSSTGYSYNETTGVSSAHTYFLGFDTTSGVAMPYCVGKVDGSVYNEYFVDKFGDYLRVATTDFESRIFVLRLPGPQDGPLMEVVGKSDQLGNISSSILGVRFFEDEAFIVTYAQNDPFIIVDLSVPEHPLSVGVLEAPGQSTYLQRVEIDGSPFVLGIGNFWNEVTFESGLKLNLFDISNRSSPQLAAEYADIGKTTNAGYDFPAVRYLPDSNSLIIPLSWYSADGVLFNAFVVYGVSVGEIKPLYNVSSSEQPNNCWYDVYIPPRSFVFESKLTTISGHTVESFDMNKEEKLWELDLDVGLNYSHCFTYSYSYVEYESANSTWDYEYGDDDLNTESP